MDCILVGKIIRKLRLEKGYTQSALAQEMNLSPKTISKWERGLGCPDVNLLAPLSRLLGVEITQMLDGELSQNQNEVGNMKKSKLYLCPECGSIALESGNMTLSCCGRTLSPLSARKASEAEELHVEQVEDEWYISSNHPMEKHNYIRFVAFLTGERAEVIRQYPEWNMELRLPKRRHGTLMWYSDTEGLLYQLI